MFVLIYGYYFRPIARGFGSCLESKVTSTTSKLLYRISKRFFKREFDGENFSYFFQEGFCLL